jgi:two-component system OmpR family sensor kinase
MTDLLLQWARGPVPLRMSRVDLVRVVGESVADTLRDAPGRQVDVSAPRTLFIHGDETHLRIAVTNLIRNALLYSPPGSDVSASVSAEGDAAVVRVRDAGAGIAADDRVALFEPMVRGSAGRSRSDGAGLGLFIARRIAEAHDGAIAAVSDAAGTVFSIAVPIREWVVV